MNSFTELFNKTKQEVLALKTQYQRKMSQLRTREYSITLDFTFQDGYYESDNFWTIYAYSLTGKIGIISYRLETDVDSQLVWEASAYKMFVGGRECYQIPVFILYYVPRTAKSVKLVITSTVELEIEAHNERLH